MKRGILIIFLYCCSLCVLATVNGPASQMDGDIIDTEYNLKETEAIDVKSVIFSHLRDAYSWHIISIHDRDITLQLPIIVHSINSGWHIFSSTKIEQGANYQGFKISTQGRFQGKIVEILANGTETRPLDFSFTKTVAALFINSFMMLFIIMGVSRWYSGKKPSDPAPKGFVGFMEMIIIMINDEIIKKNIGEDYKKYSPLLLCVFFFILINNIMGIVPFFPVGVNVTGNIAVTVLLATIIFLSINIFGNKRYWKDILWPDVPLFLKFPLPIFPIIEIIGILTKPFSLTIRLFANMMAGHAIIIALTCVILITANLGSVIGSTMPFVTLIFIVFMDILELLVSFIQAYVFTMLSAVFIGLAQQKEKKKEIEKY